jgi:DNA modification methylase
MRKYNGELFDVILTDPPYGIDSQKFDDSARLKSDHNYDDSYENWIELMTVWSVLSYKLTKPQAHAYVFCDIDRFHELKTMMIAAGWDVFRTPLISYKQNSGRVPDPTCGPRRQYELALYAIKGRKPVQAVYPDVIPNTGDNPYSDFHGAGKSTALFTNLLSRSIMPGDRVLDTFAGTFTILRAGHALQCKVTALENNPTYYGLGVRTLEELSGSNKLIGE